MLVCTVILQAMKTEPEPGFRCKDKFLILSIPVDEKLEGLSLPDLVSCGFIIIRTIVITLNSGLVSKDK
jgi:hypothetical protein